MLNFNHPTAHEGLSLADFTRESGRPPDVNIPYDRELAEAAPLGIKAMQKCKAFHRSLSRIVRDFTGEETHEKHSFLSRILSLKLFLMLEWLDIYQHFPWLTLRL